jgi:hypothetical protein
MVLAGWRRGLDGVLLGPRRPSDSGIGRINNLLRFEGHYCLSFRFALLSLLSTISFIMMLIMPLAAQEITTYVIIAPMTALEQHVAGERPLTQPTMAITKKTSTAKVVAIERIDFCTFELLFAN